MKRNSDNIFYREIWGNIYIRNNIISFLKLKGTQDLLPKYRGKRYTLSKDISKRENENKRYNYYGRKDVDKLAIYNKELLRDKIKNREKNLLFAKNPGIVIFNYFKDKTIDKEFYNNLFKNYSIYFTEKPLTLKMTIDSIIIMDCLVALLEIEFNYYHQLMNKDNTREDRGNDDYDDDDVDKNENYKNKVIFNFDHYLLSIKYGSVEISNYLSNKFKFKLIYQDVLTIVSEHFVLCPYSPISEPIFREIGFQNKSYGYKFFFPDLVISFYKIKSLKLLSNLVIEQNISNIYNQRPPTSVIPTFDCSIEMKPLQFFLDVCYLIYFISTIIEVKEFYSFDTTNEENDKFSILSKNELNEISKKFNEQDLKTQFEDFEINRKDIKNMVQLVIEFSRHGKSKNLTLYKAKYNNDFKDVDKRYLNDLALNCGSYKLFVSNNWPASPNIHHQTINLFKFCKSNSTIKKEFVQLFINDITHSYDNNNNINYNNNKQPSLLPFAQGNSLKGLGIKVIFETLISYGDIELLKMIVHSINIGPIYKEFLNICGNALVFIQDTNVFDLLYQCEQLKETFNFVNLLKNSKSSIKKTYDTTNILNHFKLKYPNDYYQCCHHLPTPIEKNVGFWFSKFVINNLQDFKNFIPLNYWGIQFEKEGFSNLREDKLITLDRFLKILEIKLNDQQYSYKDNLEFLAWIFENRKEDIDSGKLIISDNLILLEYYYYSDQLSLLLYNPIIAFSENMLIKLFTFNGFNIIKSVVKYHDIEGLKFIINFLFNIFQEHSSEKNILNFKSLLIGYIIKYNDLEALKFINENYKTFFSNLESYPNNISLLLTRNGTIEVINYILKEINFKKNIIDITNLFHWFDEK
ncbi:hypothetical protein DDB_G0278359 [Dictyostelium discoideum AX4]|uniref:Uncharacterized protein n=1 Tax=Dictyostelium discoideum TaxID=44689 RepID=Q54Y91_DICDI|nr:hypothetical protein DDB_G0278359 [Dictyostelium discoideum AX4]EAL68352.1 hypothetical protein DDB_G0278359 [Dictyostelium discoideum AX4]|eukprot:XP_642311.1 hypothetical protein DDB_G0278359 [Dictyostelium discoideum AX4]